MPKHGFLTPKAIANRIKSKGLQKLRWYCQMCQKQCRDENGFKCHLTSESHQRQLLLFSENPDNYIDSFSKEFLDDFLELLRRRFGTKRVSGNIIYQEYIADRNHTHMNSTQWETLTDLIGWLGREGHCVVDHTEKGWFIQYIDRDPDTIKRQEQLAKKEKMELDDEEQTARFIQKQIERAQAEEKEKPTTEFTALQREDEEEKVAFSLALAKKEEASSTKTKLASNALKAFSKGKESESASRSNYASSKKTEPGDRKRKSALDEIMELEEQSKEKKNRKEYWLTEGIVVKVVTKKLGDKYYKKKGVIKRVEDNYLGVVKMLDTGDKLRVDQAHLETVIPALGKLVAIVNGAYRGKTAMLLELNEKTFSCTVKINSGSLSGRVVDGIQYEDFSKLHAS